MPKPLVRVVSVQDCDTSKHLRLALECGCVVERPRKWRSCRKWRSRSWIRGRMEDPPPKRVRHECEVDDA